MANIFDTVSSRLSDDGISPRSSQSRQWFLGKVETIRKGLSRDSLMRKELKQTATIFPGMMYLFYYDPKHSKTLPYYDSFPLVILLDITKDGMTGLNLHYLPIDLRQKLFYGLINTVNSGVVDKDSYFKVTYEFLKGTRSLKEFRPCFKRYLTKHIRGGIAHVPGEEWETAVHLPLALFRKESEDAVHRKSEQMIQRF